MGLPDVIATVRRWHARVQGQSQLARDIWHLGEAARMLFEDKPDKTKAVGAVNAIAARRLGAMDADARALFDLVPAMTGDGVAHDHGERLRWLMCINDPGRFPYTQGINVPNLEAEIRTEPQVLRDAHDTRSLACALAEGWAWLAGAPDVGNAVEARALPLAIAFDEQRDAEHAALACAARRLWAVSLREFFGVRGEGLKLRLISPVGQRRADFRHDFDARATDRAEAALLAALALRVSSRMAD